MPVASTPVLFCPTIFAHRNNSDGVEWPWLALTDVIFTSMNLSPGQGASDEQCMEPATSYRDVPVRFCQVMLEIWTFMLWVLNRKRERTVTYFRSVAHTRITPVNTLGHIDWLIHIRELEVSPRNIRHIATSSTPGIPVSGIFSLPCLDPCCIRRIVEYHVLEKDIGYVVWRSWKLAYGADGHCAWTVACDIINVDVGTIAFNCNTVVAYILYESHFHFILELKWRYITILYSPILEIDVVRVPSISPIRIDSIVPVIACGIHEHICDSHIIWMRNEGMPELCLAPCQPVKD